MTSRAFVCSACVALAIATAPGAAADGNAFGPSQAPSLVEGSWEVTLKPYVCSTGVELAAQFWNFSYFNFSAGGTLFETGSNPRFQAGQRGPGYGNWERIGLDSYAAVFQAFIQFDTTPPAVPPNPTYVRGSQRFELLIDLIDADNWQGTASVKARDVAGNVVSSGCARVVATRMP